MCLWAAIAAAHDLLHAKAIFRARDGFGIGKHLGLEGLGLLIPVERIEYGFGYVILRSPCTPYAIYSRGTIH